MSSLITDQQPTRLVLAVVVAKDREVGAERWQLVFLAVAVEVGAATGHHVASLVRQGVAPQHGVASGRRGGRGNGGVSGPDEQHAREHRGEYPHARGRHGEAGCCRWQWKLARGRT